MRRILAISAVVLSAGCLRFDFEPVANGAPVPVVAPEVSVVVGQTVLLDAAATTDPDGDAVSFRWEQVGTGDPVGLENALTAVASFTAPGTPQKLFFRVHASDGVLEAPPAVVTVVVALRANVAPVARVGDTQPQVLTGATVVLDASGSTDGDGDALSFRWTQVGTSGDPVALKDAGTAVATFVAPDRPQRLFFSVVVGDGTVESAPVVVRVDVVERPNGAPQVRVASVDVRADFGANVVLDASGSTDPDGDTLTFRWTQISSGGDIVSLTDAAAAVASFTAPDTPQKLYFGVVASDGFVETIPVVVKVEVRASPNAPPVVELAHAELEVFPRAVVVLDASASFDLDGDALAFRWTQAGGDADPVNIVDGGTAVASFRAPDRPQRLFFSVVASDGKVESLPAVVRVDVLPSPNRRPVAVAAQYELSVPTGAQVLLDGRPSSDPDGEDLSYKWEQVAGAGELVTLVDATAAVASFLAPPNGARLFFRLTVSDGVSDGEPVIVGVSVYSAPEVLSVPPVFSPNGTPVQITAQAIDRDGDQIVSWAWSVKRTPTGGESCLERLDACLFGVGAQTVTFTPPVKGDYELEVSAGDGRLSSRPRVVLVRATNRGPVVPAVELSSATTPSGTPVTVTAVGASDPDGDDVREYVFRSAPNGLFTPTGTGVATFKPTTRGLHRISVAAKDEFGAEGPATDVNLLVDNAPPTCAVGDALSVLNGSEAVLGGTAVDPDRDAVSFQWQLVDFPAGGRVSLVGADASLVRFTPTKKSLKTRASECGPGECYVLEFSATDGTAACTPARVTVLSLNRAPLANAGNDAVVGTPTLPLDGSASTDADGDALTWRWTQVLGPDVTSGAGFLEGRSVTVPHLGVGAYRFELVVHDGTAASAPDSVRFDVTSDEKPPALVLRATQDVAAEGTTFTRLDASGSTDPNGGALTFVWSRVAGSALWPALLVGEKPTLTAPAFDALLAEGSNRARYEVYAQDATNLRSPTQLVEVFAGPGASYVVVSTGAHASDAATPSCGTVATPCASLRKALQVVDPEGDRTGSGRAVLLTSGLFRSIHNVLGHHRVPSGTRLVGGFHPVTFEPGGETEVRVESDCVGVPSALELSPQSVNVVVENLRLTAARGAGCVPNEADAVRCDNCRATFRDVTAVSVEDHCTNQAFAISGSTAVVTLEDVTARAGRAVCGVGRAVGLYAGAQANITDAHLSVTLVANVGAQALFAEDSRAVVKRSTMEVLGNSAAFPDRFQAVLANGSIVSVENSVLRNVAMPGSHGLSSVNGSSVTMLHSTVVGAGFATSTGAAVRTTDQINLVGNLLMDFAVGVSLDAAAALRSKLFANALVPTTASLGLCNGTTPVTTLSSFNAATGTTCNQGGVEWTDNVAQRCPLVDPAAGDFHLNTAVTNPCVDAGLAASPGGNAPALDFEQQARPLGARPDIGADEAK